VSSIPDYLPKGWTQTSIGSIRNDETSGVDPTTAPDEAFDLYSIPAHDRKTFEHVLGKDIGSAKKLLTPGTVLLSKLNPRINRVGIVGPFRGYRQVGSSEWIPFSPLPGIDSTFLAYFLRQELVRAHLASNVSGVGGSLTRTNSSIVDALLIPIPPLEEQKRIAETLERLLSRLASANENLERAQAKLRAYRASALKAAVEGQLVPQEAELARAENRNYEPADVLLKRILLRNAVRSKDRFRDDHATEERFHLPDGWAWSTVNQLTSHITSGSRDWSQYYGTGRSVFLMAQNVRPGRLDLSFRQLVDPPIADPSRDRSQVQVGDLLVTIVGANTGQVARVPVPLPDHYVCQSVALMRPVEPAMSPFLDMYLNSPVGQRIFEQFMYGQGRPHLSFDQLRETRVPVPPLSEQLRIVAKYEQISSVIDNAYTEIEQCLTRCVKLRQSILKSAFEGSLVDQDPSDEPASRLLERVSRERRSDAASKTVRSRRKAKTTTR
jgi:type I restriction enzyme, S subunit